MQARHRQVLMIAALFLLPLFRVVSVGVAVAVVVALGAMGALPTLIAGFGIVLAAGLLSPVDPGGVVLYVGLFAGAGLLIGELLRGTQSMTLTIQVTVLLAMAGALAFQLSIGDSAAFWVPRLNEMVQMLVERGAISGQLDAQTLATLVEINAPLATGLFAASQWYFAVLALVIGYYLFDHGVDASKLRFGRFRELNLGRVLAALMVLLAVGAALTGSMLLTNLAIILLLAFGLQGFAMLHWAKYRFAWPVAALVVCYAAVILVQPYGVLLICVAGYVDAWFNLIRGRHDNAAS